MALLTWGNQYSVGVSALDKQHANLFCILNELNDAMKSGQSKMVLGPLLDELMAYTRHHFADEERRMKEADYPGLETHRIQHEALTRQVVEFAARFKSGEAALSIELMEFLRNWLAGHIQGADKEYAPWMSKPSVQ